MAERTALWRWLIEAIDGHRPAALLIVAESLGSTPGKAGAKMAVTADASIGTIGGGLIEAEMIMMVRSMLTNGDTIPQIVSRAHHESRGIVSSGMICGGTQGVLIYPCKSDDKVAFEHLIASCLDRSPLNLEISERGLRVERSSCLESPKFYDGEAWRYEETVGLYKCAYIIGAGHVGISLAKLLDMLGFDVSLVDDRMPMSVMSECAFARQIIERPYGDIDSVVPSGADVFVFVMTHDHHSDELVLSRLLGKHFAYLGLLGSRHKVHSLKEKFARHFGAEHMLRLHAPMGMAINSHTPEEIAVSVAAEVIQVCNLNAK